MSNAWIMTGQKTALRTMTGEDQPHFHTWLKNPKLRELIDDPNIPTWEGQKQWFERLQQQYDRALFSIIVLPEETLIGNGGLVDIEPTQAQLRISIANPDAWDKGYGSEIVGLIIRYAFEQRGLQSVWLRVRTDNPRAIRVYEKNGFRRENIDEKGLLHMRIDAPQMR